MCCLTFFLRDKLLKILLFATGLFYLGLSGWLIYMGVLIKRSGLWTLVTSTSIFRDNFDMDSMMYITCIACGCFCFLTSFMSLISSCYPFKLCYFPVTNNHINKSYSLACSPFYSQVQWLHSVWQPCGLEVTCKRKSHVIGVRWFHKWSLRLKMRIIIGVIRCSAGGVALRSAHALRYNRRCGHRGVGTQVRYSWTVNLMVQLRV